MINNAFLRKQVAPVICSQQLQQRRQIYRKAPVITDNYKLVYEGPKSKGMKYLRWCTVAAATLAPFGHPYGVFLGIFTVFIVHKTSKPYVTKLYFDEELRKFIAETYSLLGLPLRFKFHVSQIILPNEAPHMRSTFRVDKQEFYLHYEVEEAQQIFDFIQDYNGDNITDETVVAEEKSVAKNLAQDVVVAQTVAADVASETVATAAEAEAEPKAETEAKVETENVEEAENLPDIEDTTIVGQEKFNAEIIKDPAADEATKV